MVPLLEESGLRAGEDFALAFSPERVDPGNPTFHTHNVPKVVGGLTPDCAKLAGALYGSAIQTIVPVSSTRVAEMVKLLENTFRAVNIGLVNELALMCDRMHIDVWEVVDAAKTKPFGFMAFYPGPGLGGHCIPIDPFYLSWKAKQSGFDPRFIELAGHINAGMPHYVVDKVMDALNTRRKAINGSRVLVAGVAYKRDIDDMRESPALDVMHLLEAKGATVDYADPFVPEVHGREWAGRRDIKAVPLTRGVLRQYDCVVIVTDHSTFDYAAMVAEADVIVDTRNAIKEPHPNVFRLGAPRPEAASESVTA
jgi:UDP-N-acetyl-D-glucosamine dehydrogenase